MNTDSLKDSRKMERGKNSGLNRMGLGIDHLWLLAILLCFAFVISPMPVGPNDFWWHLKIGERIYQTASIPSTSIYSWSLSADHPYTYGAWFAGYLMYLVYKIGGVTLIIFMRNALTVLAFALVSLEAWRRSGSWRIAALVTLFACAMASNNFEVRPQMWAWLPFILFYILLSRYTSGQLKAGWLLLLPLSMVFWVNVHGAFVLGPVILGIFIAGEALRIFLKQEGKLSWKSVGWMGVITALTGAAMLANPKFTGIIGYVYNMMVDQPSQKLVVEWQSPAPNTYAAIFFYLSILLMLGLFAYSRYRPTPTEALLIAGFLWLAWSGVRYVVWYGIVSMPILAATIKEMVKGKPWMVVPPRNILNLAIVAVLAIPAVLVQPWFIERLPMPEAYWNVVLRDSGVGPMLSVNTPIGATEYLKENPGGRLFNEMGFGSYLIWAVPEQGVFVDTRVELYPYDQWLDYIRIGNGIRYNELLDQYGADRLLLHPKLQGELITQLEMDPLWVLEYQDDYAQIWTKAP